jgi:hypothetical protein
MDCLDCDRIGLNRTKGFIRCKEDQWKTENGQDKIVKLNLTERRGGEIQYRRIFRQGGPSCSHFEEPGKE